MPSFILRQLDPEFWAKVQAKAAAEGTTVKAVILRLLAAWLAAVVILGVTGCGSSPTAPSVTASLPPVVALPPAYVPPAFTLAGLTTCGRPSDSTWTLAMADAGRDGARFTTTVAHSDLDGCIRGSGAVVHVDDAALLGVHGDTAYAPNGAGTTTFTYAADAFRCGSSEITIRMTADDGRPLGTVANAVINYGVHCNLPAPPPPGNPAPPIPLPPAAPLPLMGTMAASPASVRVGQTITFTATVSNLLPGETVTSYEWDLDSNGSYEATTSGPSRTSAPYSAKGGYVAQVRVTTSLERSNVVGTRFDVTP